MTKFIAKMIQFLVYFNQIGNYLHGYKEMKSKYSLQLHRMQN